MCFMVMNYLKFWANSRASKVIFIFILSETGIILKRTVAGLRIERGPLRPTKGTGMFLRASIDLGE